jgi:Ca2+-binding RTX toxin-like protein
MEMTMIARNAARMPGTSLVTETADFGEPVMVDIAGIDPVYGGSIGPVMSTPHAPDPIFGTNGSDVDLFGTSGDDVIKGLDGKDWLYGLAGNDILDGGRGADVMAGGKGDDTYHVGNSLDVIWEWGGEGTDTVLLELGNGYGFFLPTAVENLVLAGSAREGNGNDLDNVIIGNAAENWIYAYGGNDTIDGGFGNDGLHGDHGDDTIEGGFGNDVLYGEGGNDNLSGGATTTLYVVGRARIL